MTASIVWCDWQQVHKLLRNMLNSGKPFAAKSHDLHISSYDKFLNQFYSEENYSVFSLSDSTP